MGVKRIIAAVTDDGGIRLVEQDVPPVRAGAVLVEVRRSLISTGTELGGWRAFARRTGHPAPDVSPRTFGYSNSGVVLEVGVGVDDFAPGDRVASVGAGYALHTDYAVVPHNLCVGLPDNVTFDQGAYAMLAATAIYALRRGEAEFGEYCAVAGLGLLGQLTARIHQLAGCFVIGWDLIERRNQIAMGWGIDATALVGAEDEVKATDTFTLGHGLDRGVMAFGEDGTDAFRGLTRSMKVSPDGHPMGIVVVVGGTTFHYEGGLTNIDIRQASRTGPGYHDEAWEHGPPYPSVFMRWTTRTNLELAMRLIQEGKLDVDALTTHTIPLKNLEREIVALIAEPDEMLGVVLQMDG
jgi:threonine dehydrogenase-like Zn-dependent dehydrogenase